MALYQVVVRIENFAPSKSFAGRSSGTSVFSSPASASAASVSSAVTEADVLLSSVSFGSCAQPAAPAAAPETGDQVHALFRVMQIAAEQYFGKPAVKAEEKE